MMMISFMFMITICLLCSHTINTTTTTITTINDTIDNEHNNAIITDGQDDVHRRLEGQQYKIINGIKYMVKRTRRPRHESIDSSNNHDSNNDKSVVKSIAPPPPPSPLPPSSPTVPSPTSAPKKRVSYLFKNSKLGTTEYNKESEVIALAKSDYERSKSQNRKGILCVSFVRASMQTAMTIYSNMIQVQGYCTWAIIFYDGSKSVENDICRKIKSEPKNKIAVCKRSAYALSEHGTKADVNQNADEISPVENIYDTFFNESTIDHPPLNETELLQLLKDETNKEVIVEEGDDENSLSIDDDDNKLKELVLQKGRKSIPKSVLYSDLLPYLYEYKKVFLMDEDISLVGFNFKKTMTVWNCAFYPKPPPLIVQPLIAESKQFFNFVGSKAWAGKGVVASASGLIEQQVPMFDAVFFEWFVRRCFSMTKQQAINAGVDWGGDRSWCNAAKMYAREVLNLPKEYVHCGLLVAGSPVHHLNTKAIAAKRTNRKEFLRKGFQMVDKYVNLFPTWTILDIVRAPNPLDRFHGRKYVKSMRINSTCVAEYQNIMF